MIRRFAVETRGQGLREPFYTHDAQGLDDQIRFHCREIGNFR